ncbi:hypothetical protein F5I97DRAFT_1829715 [Phlebopus sp. FC_14]|nr:hypothetical protein F5I97DRAFT_1829715 [Phlebopus sp. FC_14]
MIELFILSSTVFKKPCSSPVPPFGCAEHHQTKALAEAALIAELQPFIDDEDLIKLMKSPHFHMTFEKASSAIQSTIVNNLCSVMGKIINLLVTNQKLFDNWQVLAKILKVVLFSLKSLQISRQLWEIMVITPSAIAWAIMTVIAQDWFRRFRIKSGIHHIK